MHDEILTDCCKVHMRSLETDNADACAADACATL